MNRKVVKMLEFFLLFLYSSYSCSEAPWQSGYAADCKSVYTGSTPVRASIKKSCICMLDKEIEFQHNKCLVFPGSSAVEQLTVNQLVAGSNPARGATFPYVRDLPFLHLLR